METQTNADLLREAFARWDETRGSELGIWEPYLTEDVELFTLAGELPDVPFLVSCKGAEEVRSYLGGLTEAMAMDHWRIDETISEGDRVVGIGSTGRTHRETGKSFVTPIVVVTRWRDGRIREYAEYYDTARIAGVAA